MEWGINDRPKRRVLRSELSLELHLVHSRMIEMIWLTSPERITERAQHCQALFFSFPWRNWSRWTVSTFKEHCGRDRGRVKPGQSSKLSPNLQYEAEGLSFMYIRKCCGSTLAMKTPRTLWFMKWLLSLARRLSGTQLCSAEEVCLLNAAGVYSVLLDGHVHSCRRWSVVKAEVKSWQTGCSIH